MQYLAYCLILLLLEHRQNRLHLDHIQSYFAVFERLQYLCHHPHKDVYTVSLTDLPVFCGNFFVTGFCLFIVANSLSNSPLGLIMLSLFRLDENDNRYIYCWFQYFDAKKPCFKLLRALFDRLAPYFESYFRRLKGAFKAFK